MVGGVTSETVNVVVQVVELLAASFTVIVTVVAPLPTSVPATGDCVIVSEPAAVQLSVAATPPVKLGTAPWQLAFALVVCGAGQVVIVGGVRSETVNVVVQVVELLAASFTVIVTVVVPVPTTVPATGDCVIVSEPAAVQLSVAATPPVKFGTAAWQLLFALAV